MNGQHIGGSRTALLIDQPCDVCVGVVLSFKPAAVRTGLWSCPRAVSYVADEKSMQGSQGSAPVPDIPSAHYICRRLSQADFNGLREVSGNLRQALTMLPT